MSEEGLSDVPWRSTVFWNFGFENEELVAINGRGTAFKYNGQTPIFLKLACD